MSSNQWKKFLQNAGKHGGKNNVTPLRKLIEHSPLIEIVTKLFSIETKLKIFEKLCKQKYKAPFFENINYFGTFQVF